MKPKYEIDQEVYLKDKQVTIYGIKRLLDRRIAYNLEGYPNELFTEDKLSLTPPDEKKYYILFRSLDLLERKDLAPENFKVSDCLKLSSRGDEENVKYRTYKYVRSDFRDDGKTVVYIYEEAQVNHKELSPKEIDDKKYYILYRSLDGLEKQEGFSKPRILSPNKFRPKTSSCLSNPPFDAREYRYIGEELRDDGKTVVYVYEEV